MMILTLKTFPVNYFMSFVYRYDVDGNFLIAGAENGQVFVIDGRASKDFNPIGYTGKWQTKNLLRNI